MKRLRSLEPARMPLRTALALAIAVALGAWCACGTKSLSFSVVYSSDVVGDGKVLLKFTRVSQVEPRPNLMHMIAEADGASISAFLDGGGKSDTGCGVWSTHRKALRHGKTLFKIEGD